LERFRREAELGARIVHPNVVRTLDFVGPDCLVLEYVEGHTLEQRQEEGACFPEAECRHLAGEILRGLVAVHAAGAVHRDLKPSNVMLAAGGDVRLMDLGVALPLDDMLRLSRTGQFVGTVRYSAPEQLTDSKAELDGRTDLYALGLLLHELIAGEHPFPRTGLVSMMRAQLDTVPPPLSSVDARVTRSFEALVASLTAKNPADRPLSAEAVLALL
jgi:serine/threonine protein kinase